MATEATARTMTMPDFTASIAECARKTHERGVARMLSQRWRIREAVYPGTATKLTAKPVVGGGFMLGVDFGEPFPTDTPTLTRMLTDCRSRIRGEEQRGREGHWTYSQGGQARLLTLREAASALETILAEERT